MLAASKWIGIGGTLLAGTAVGAAGEQVTVGGEAWHHSEWRASTFAMSAQAQASLAMNADGTLVVVWSSRRQQGGRYGVYGQRFDSSGVAIGEETKLNLWTDSHQWMPAVTSGAAPGTAPWVVWTSHGQDGHAGAIVARRLDFAGRPTWNGGSEVLVNEDWLGHQSGPTVALAPRGGGLVTWTSVAGADALSEVRARLFDGDGLPAGLEFGVCDGGEWHQRSPSAAFAGDGSLAIVYAVAGDDPEPTGIRMQRYGADGEPVGAFIDVSGGRRLSQVEPVIAATADGYLVAWIDAESDGSDYGVLARRFDFTGVPRGEAFVVNDRGEGPQIAPAIAVAPDGRFVIAYNDADQDESGVFGRMFAADGSPRGDAFRINGHTAGKQAMQIGAGTHRLAFAPNGSLLCAWSGDGGLGDASAVHVTMLSPQPTDLAGREQGVTADMRPAPGAEMVAEMLAAAGAPEPHRPPTFDPKEVDDAERTIILSPGGNGFTAVVNTGWTPPDPHMAVGPAHVVVMTNGNISFFEKDGTRTFTDLIEGAAGFWGELGTTGFVFDPEVLYDELSGRFFAMAAEGRAPGSRSYALVAVSDDSDPNGPWHKYRLETTVHAGDLFDSPNIGVDADVVYVTGDGFGRGRNYPVFTYDKASMLAGDPIAIQRSTTLSTSTQSAGIPPVSFDDPPALYMIEHRESSVNNLVRLIALQDPLGSITFTETLLAVPSYRSPPEDPPQSGTGSRPEAFDVRFWSVAYRNGSLWATHHIDPGRVRARWYEIRMNGWPDSGQTPELAQSGEIDPGPGIRTFFCSITVDDAGNAAMTYSRSSPDEFISMETAIRSAADPPGTFQPGVQRAVNSGAYTAGRWGDYSAVNVDPADGTFWAHHEFAQGSSWRTWVQNFGPLCGLADVNCDGVVDFADLLLVLRAWGPCKGCPEDISGNGIVGFEDILLLLGAWST